MLEHEFKTKPYAGIESKLRQESMLQHKTLIELRIQTEAMAEITSKHMTSPQPERLAHNFPPFYDDSSKDTESQREQAMLCDNLSQVPTLVSHFVQESGEVCAEASGYLDEVWYYIKKGCMNEAKNASQNFSLKRIRILTNCTMR